MQTDQIYYGIILIQYFTPILKLIYYTGVAIDFRRNKQPNTDPYTFSKSQLATMIIISQINILLILRYLLELSRVESDSLLSVGIIQLFFYVILDFLYVTNLLQVNYRQFQNTNIKTLCLLLTGMLIQWLIGYGLIQLFFLSSIVADIIIVALSFYRLPLVIYFFTVQIKPNIPKLTILYEVCIVVYLSGCISSFDESITMQFVIAIVVLFNYVLLNLMRCFFKNYTQGAYSIIKNLNEIKDTERIRLQDNLSESQGNEMICSICLDQIIRMETQSDIRKSISLVQEEKKLVKTICNHYYHFDCLIPWIEKHNKCPLCQTVL
ncbi:hypothetical protein pb186bvf_019406 [Paramecium bursaria]